jgi:hypothetical protein
MGTIT